MPLECKHCGEQISGKKACAICGVVRVDQCATCHKELSHGVMPALTDSRPSTSSNTVERQATKRTS